MKEFCDLKENAETVLIKVLDFNRHIEQHLVQIDIRHNVSLWVFKDVFREQVLRWENELRSTMQLVLFPQRKLEHLLAVELLEQ